MGRPVCRRWHLHAPSGFIFPDPPNHGPLHPDFQQLGWISLEWILSEHHQVRELTWLNGALQIFLKGRVRPIDRATMDSFLQGDTLICTPNVALHVRAGELRLQPHHGIGRAGCVIG